MSAPQLTMGNDGDVIKKLTEILDVIFEAMKNKGLIKGDAVKNKKTIIDNLAKQLAKNPDIVSGIKSKSLTLDTIKNNSMLEQVFVLSIVSEAAETMKPGKGMRLDYNALFNSQKEAMNDSKNIQPTTFKDELKEAFKKALSSFFIKNDPKQKLNAKELTGLNALFNVMLNKMFGKKDPQEKNQPDLKQSKLEQSQAAKALALTLTSLYGMPPGEAGQIAPVIQFVLGNPSGQVDYSVGRDGSFMSDQNEAERGQADYTGAEQSALNNMMDLLPAIATSLQVVGLAAADLHGLNLNETKDENQRPDNENQSKLHNPFKTKPSPFSNG